MEPGRGETFLTVAVELSKDQAEPERSRPDAPTATLEPVRDRRYSVCLLCCPTTNSVVTRILRSSQSDQFSR